MLAIVLGFTDSGSQSPFEVIYAGRSASDARALADAPPVGFVRTESLNNPVTHHRRYFPGNVLGEGEDLEAEFAEVDEQLAAENERLTGELQELADEKVALEAKAKADLEKKDQELAAQVKNFDSSWKQITEENEALNERLSAADEQKRLIEEKSAEDAAEIKRLKGELATAAATKGPDAADTQKGAADGKEPAPLLPDTAGTVKDGAKKK
ncbi:MAG: hypothetical protein EOP87_25605 [Verrucomicrobiaceae bacterium]|nr:MAG: hypothetical protein EOP87_25605 [Verrucomicrobiaceae bacterium]